MGGDSVCGWSVLLSVMQCDEWSGVVSVGLSVQPHVWISTLAVACACLLACLLSSRDGHDGIQKWIDMVCIRVSL